MMKHYILLLVFAISLTACEEQKEPPIPKEKLGEVLTDIHLAEIYSTMWHDSEHYSGPRNMDSLALYYKLILEHHHISLQDLKETLEWYTMHSQEFDSVYASVQPVISKMEAEHPVQ